MTISADTPEKLKFQFVVSPRTPETFQCISVAEFLDADISFSEVIGDSKTSFKGRPLLFTSDGVIFSSYAICKYLLRCDSNVFRREKLFPSLFRSEIDEWLEWTISRLSPVVHGSDHHEFLRALRRLDSHLSDKTHQKYSFIEGICDPCLVDVFIYSVLLSRLRLILSCDCSNLKVYMRQMSDVPFISKVKKKYSSMTASTFDTECIGLKYYITTAINYTNGPPHIGHAYEIITTDILARYQRFLGRDVFFLTGTDEHGQKISNAAAEANMSPLELCDRYSGMFQELNSKLSISNDFFIRTTSLKHASLAKSLWTKALNNGDIYLSTYRGWYNTREETFVTERDAASYDYKDPATGKPLEKMEEQSYFFRMSKYQQQLIDHIQSHSDFIQPPTRLNDISRRLKDPLEDLSISRTKFKWGISVPNSVDHVMYVWFDALSNYLSGIDYGVGPRSNYWPADIHIIGKDILWFHCVIWPCILMSAKIPLPKTVFAHGFVNAADGRKMSKSFGTVVDTTEVLKSFPPDSLRYYIAQEGRYGCDVKFDIDNMIDCHNGDMADVVGNLLNRAVGLADRYCEARVPNEKVPSDVPVDFETVVAELQQHVNNFNLQEAIEVSMSVFKELNGYVTLKAPWAEKNKKKQRQIVRAILEVLYVAAHMMEPVIPTTAAVIFSHLGTPKRPIKDLSPFFDNLAPDTQITKCEILFSKVPARRNLIKE